MAFNTALTNAFFNPPDTGGGNAVYTYASVYEMGSFLNVTWATNATDYELQLWQQALHSQSANRGPTIHQVTAQSQPASTFQVQNLTWIVAAYNLDLSWSNVFFLYAFSGTEPLFTSHYFNITDVPLTTTTATTPLTANTAAIQLVESTVAASPTSQRTVLPLSTGTGQEFAQAPANDSITTGTKIGIGVGVGVGFCILVVICTLIGFWIAGKKRLVAMQPSFERNTTGAAVAESAPPPSYLVSPSKLRSKTSCSAMTGKYAAYSADDYLRDLCEPQVIELSGCRSPAELGPYRNGD